MKDNTVLINAIIVDDQKKSIDILSKDLSRYADIKVIEATTSIEKAKTTILKSQPTLLFLDIEMPRQTGLEFLQEISSYIHTSTCVVFYSAFDRYMIDALRLSAFDFLLKPYQLKELDSIINRVRSKILSGKINFDPSKYAAFNQEKRFGIHTSLGQLLLTKREVLYFNYSSKSRCWYLKLTNFTEHKLQTTTKDKDILNMNEAFVQISKEYIINIDYLSFINSDSYKCSLYPPFQNIELYTSRIYYSRLRDRFDFF